MSSTNVEIRSNNDTATAIIPDADHHQDHHPMRRVVQPVNYAYQSRVLDAVARLRRGEDAADIREIHGGCVLREAWQRIASANVAPTAGGMGRACR